MLAVSTVIAARFGAGGGDEARRSEFLSALRAQARAGEGRRGLERPQRAGRRRRAGVGAGRFPSARPRSLGGAGAVVLDDGEPGSHPRSPSRPSSMSNAILVGASRSATGHPMFVAGPQVGYFFPEVVIEYDLHGGGIDVRGAAVPGLPYVVVGRGKDFAWSATSSNADIVDTFAETLCGGDDLHYLYKGECRAMTMFDAGVLQGSPGQPDTQVVFRETVLTGR